MIDETKPYLTGADGAVFQVLDEAGEYDATATAAAYYTDLPAEDRTVLSDAIAAVEAEMEARDPLPPIEVETFDAATVLEGTVTQVAEYAEAHPEHILDLINAETAGQGRTTLLARLSTLLP